MHDFLSDSRFEGIKSLESRAFLALATPHEKDEESRHVEM